MKTNFNQNSLLNKAQMNLDIIILPFAFVIIIAIMSVATSFQFLSYSNLSSLAFQLPELGFLVLAMTLAMTTGGIDMSLISTANLAGVTMVILMKAIPADASGGYTALLLSGVIVVGLLIATLLGMVNGFLVAYVEVSPTLATLSTMILYEGLTLSITKGRVISGIPEMFRTIGNGTFLWIPIPFIIFIIIAFIVRLVVKRTPLGKYQVMIGSNKKAMEYAGINVRKVLVKTYMICGLLAGMASVIMASRLSGANARFGSSYMLLSVLIAVLGGTNPEGGYVRVGGVIVALFTLQALNSGINALGISQYIALTLWGVLLVLIIMYRHYAVQKRNKLLSNISKEK